MQPSSSTSFRPRPYDEHGIDAIDSSSLCEKITDNEEVTAFIVAVADGNLKSVKTTLRSCQESQSRAVDRDLAGAHRGERRTQGVKALVNAVAFSGQSVVQLAVAGRHTAVLDELLSNGATPNHLTNDGQSALALACRRGCETMATMLLKAGASVNTTSDREISALQAAIENDHFGIAEMLLAAKANPNQQFVGQYCTDTPLTSACRSHNTSLVRLLIEAGATPDLPAGGNVTPLMVVCMTGALDLVHLLLKQSVYVNVSDAIGETALHHAVRAGHVEVVKLLLQAKAEVNAVSSQGSALHLTVIRGFPELACILVGAGADPDAAAPNATTPLVEAVKHGRQWFITQLIDAGADVNKIHNKTTALQTAHDYNKKALMLRLLEAGADPNVYWGPRSPLHALLDVLQPRDVGLVQALLAAGADVHAKYEGRDVLQCALARLSTTHDVGVLKRLLQAGSVANALHCLRGHTGRETEAAVITLLAGGDTPRE
jgi:ankyrin repeat protein